MGSDDDIVDGLIAAAYKGGRRPICPGCAERDTKIAELEKRVAELYRWRIEDVDENVALREQIAELEKRPTHESVLAWLYDHIGDVKDQIKGGEDVFSIWNAYRAEFMEPADAD